MKIITANRLGDGVAVYFTGTSWSEQIGDAKLADDPSAAATLRDQAWIDERENRVVSPYPIDVELIDGVPNPKDKKERVRAVGPSVRQDLNRPTSGA